jgi:heme-degrading monooxygenase HmoA
MPDFQGDARQYMIVWEFQVQNGMDSQFEAFYGPDGDWARLFRQAAGYQKTHLGRDPDSAGRYLTVDFWSSHKAYSDFQQQFAAQYKALDQKCEGMTLSERKIGTFEIF